MPVLLLLLLFFINLSTFLFAITLILIEIYIRRISHSILCNSIELNSLLSNFCRVLIFYIL